MGQSGAEIFRIYVPESELPHGKISCRNPATTEDGELNVIKLGRISQSTRGTPVIPFWVEDRIDYQPGNKEPLA